MALEFSSAGQQSLNGGVKFVVYGPAGMGKTVLCATMPCPVLISAEAGLLSLRKQNLERIFGVGNPSITYDMPVITIRSVEDINLLLTWIETSPQARNFQSLAIDSASEIAEMVLLNSKRLMKDPRMAYGEMITKMQEVVTTFRDMPGRHVCFVSKMGPSKDEMTGLTTYGPLMPGKALGTLLPYWTDEVFRLGVAKTDKGESYRFLQTQPDLQYQAKDRSGALAPIEPPHLGAIIHKIMGA